MKEDLSLLPFKTQERIECCRVLYMQLQGRHHERIERDMREMGHERFCRRVLYARESRSGKRLPGWPERFGWGGKREKATLREKYNHGKARRERKAKDSSNSSNSPNSFTSWLRRISPPSYRWDRPFQQYILEKLERFSRGEITRLMIFMPPRHGKSELVTVRYAAWRLRQRPEEKIVIASYAQKLANRFSRQIKRVAADDELLGGGTRNRAFPIHDKTRCPECIAKAAACPNRNWAGRCSIKEAEDQSQHPEKPEKPATNWLVRPKDTESEWETPEGGGVKAIGAGAGITGFGANLIIVDDPVRSRQDAESATIRENIWQWFNDDLYTRLEPNGQIILIQTRWHQDDLAGRLLTEAREDDGEQWEVIDLPAFAEPAPAEPGEDTFEKLTDALPEPPKMPAYINLNGVMTPIYPPGALKSEYGFGEKVERRKEKGEREENPQTPSNSAISSNSPNSPNWKDILGRTLGEPLWPERFDERRLESYRRKLGSYSFAALYQQRPVPSGGGFFKRHWFQVVDFAPPGTRWRRAYDLAFTAGDRSDYTASARVGFDNKGSIYIDKVLRRRMEYPEQRRIVIGLIRKETDAEHLIEETANGAALIQELRRSPKLLGRRFRAVKVRESKTARALAWNALAEEGRVYLVRGPWNREFIEEACSFPYGKHDDQIDAVSLAVKDRGSRYRSYAA